MLMRQSCASSKAKKYTEFFSSCSKQMNEWKRRHRKGMAEGREPIVFFFRQMLPWKNVALLLWCFCTHIRLNVIIAHSCQVSTFLLPISSAKNMNIFYFLRSLFSILLFQIFLRSVLFSALLSIRLFFRLVLKWHLNDLNEIFVRI